MAAGSKERQAYGSKEDGVMTAARMCLRLLSWLRIEYMKVGGMLIHWCLGKKRGEAAGPIYVTRWE